MSFTHYLETGELLREELVAESIHDKNKFKSVFMAGGGGSGKSFIAKLMFAGRDVPVINADNLIPPMFKKRELPLKFDPEHKELYTKQMAARGEAQKLMAKKESTWIKGMTPVIIDGTGKEYEKIKGLKDWLESIGYDTAMVFVNTTLPVALQRNKERYEKDPENERYVNPKETTKAWHEAQANIGKFQTLFGKFFKIVDNSETTTKGTPEYKAKELEMTRSAINFIEAPLRNPIGNKKIAQLEKENRMNLTDEEIAKPEKTEAQTKKDTEST